MTSVVTRPTRAQAARESFQRDLERMKSMMVGGSNLRFGRQKRKSTLELALYRGLMWHSQSFSYGPSQYDRRASSFISDESTPSEESMLREEFSEAGFYQNWKKRCTIQTLRGRYFQIYSALTGAMGALVAGTLMGWASSVVERFNPRSHSARFDLTKQETISILTALPVGMMVAAGPTCVLLDLLGRHVLVAISAAPMMASWIQVLVATTPYHIFLARLVSGIGCGILFTSLPVYLCEVVEPKLRGTMGCLLALLLSAGILLAFALIEFVNFPMNIAVMMTLPIVFFVLFLFAAESPVFYCLRECWSTAYVSLKKLRPEEDTQFEIEYEDKMISTDISRQITFGFKNLSINRHVMRSFFLSSILFFIFALSGIFTVYAYMKQIFEDAKTPMDIGTIALLIVGFQMVSSAIPVVLVDVCGRRPLLLASLFGCAASLALLGTLYTIHESPAHIPEEVLAWGCLIFILAYVSFFSLGIGSIPWVMLEELSLPGVRGAATGSAVFFMAFSGILSTKFFVDVQYTWGYSTTSWVYSLVSTVGALFVGYLIPETKGHFIIDIHRKMYDMEEKDNEEESASEVEYL